MKVAEGFFHKGYKCLRPDVASSRGLASLIPDNVPSVSLLAHVGGIQQGSLGEHNRMNENAKL